MKELILISILTFIFGFILGLIFSNIIIKKIFEDIIGRFFNK